MAFSASEFIPLSAMANSSSARVFSYTTAADNIAAVKGSGYFNSAALLTGGLGLKGGDVILATASDATNWIQVAVSGTGVVTTTVAAAFA